MNQCLKWLNERSKVVTPILLVVVLGLVGFAALRTYRDYSVPGPEFDWEKRGHSDFHNGTYYPTTAFRHGDNPYAADVVDKYPMTRSAPLFSPSIFILHLPFSFFELRVADVLFFAANTLLIFGLAIAAIRMSGLSFKVVVFLAISSLLLLSRPGHITLFTGYFTAELVLGTAIALHFARTKPALAGIGLLLASGKPNFIIPLIVLMLFRRDFKAVFFGLIFCAAVALAGVFWLASFSSVGEIIEGFRQGQEALHTDETELPFNTWTRVDLTGMTAKVLRANPSDSIYLAVMFGLLIVPGIALYRLAKTPYAYGATGLTGMIISISVLLSIYHHSYDCLILAVPWVGIALAGDRTVPELSPQLRGCVTLLTAVPAANYLSTLAARSILQLDPGGWVWQAITLINGVCLFAALVILLIAARRHINQTSIRNHGSS